MVIQICTSLVLRGNASTLYTRDIRGVAIGAHPEHVIPFRTYGMLVTRSSQCGPSTCSNCLLVGLHARQGLLKMPLHGVGHSLGSVTNLKKEEQVHPAGARGHDSLTEATDRQGPEATYFALLQHGGQEVMLSLCNAQ